MATGWQSFPLEFTGGLVSNLSRLQHGVKAPGSARLLVNFEPSTQGGYRRINGYDKYSESFVPTFGSTVVQGGSQTGTSLVVGNLYVAPVNGDTFTIAGDATEYTVSSASHSIINQEATLTITPTLAATPADKAAVTFGNNDTLTEGLYHFWDSIGAVGKTIAVRDSVIWTSSGAGWSDVSAPSYGTVLVDGGSQTGATLTVKAITSDTYVPKVGDVFSVAGIEKVYTVLAEPTVTSGVATISIYPSLASSPADEAGITFLGSKMTQATKVRFDQFNYGSTEKVVLVDGFNAPRTYDNTNGMVVIDGSTDVVGANHAVSFRNHMFYAKDNTLTFSAPLNENDFTPGNGGGAFVLPSSATGLIVFREQLIIFTGRSIHKLVGNSAADFVLSDISTDMGCVREDTIQEVGGDVVFMGPDGVRLLGATARIGDFSLALMSRPIQNDMITFSDAYTSYCSLKVREKSQYRVFGYSAAITRVSTSSYIAKQVSDQGEQGFHWGEVQGFKAYAATSAYTDDEELVLFSNTDGYVYQAESGNSFDGEPISAYFYTPFIPIGDPRVRKTLYKATTYYDPEGSVEGSVSFKYDFIDPSKIQPGSADIGGGGGTVYFGTAVYNTDVYTPTVQTTIESHATGSFFTVSLQYAFTNQIIPPFVLDTAVLEYTPNDRK
jgi:hypothetical protein